MLHSYSVYDIVIILSAHSGLLYSTLGQLMRALDSLSIAAKYQPQDHSIFLYRAKIYEKVLCSSLYTVLIRI